MTVFFLQWCQLKSRKENLLALFEKMRSYQMDQVMKDPDAPIPDSLRLIKDSDIERLQMVQTAEELQDVHNHFVLYYAQVIVLKLYVNHFLIVSMIRERSKAKYLT